MAVNVILLTIEQNRLFEKCTYVKINAKIIVKNINCLLFPHLLLFAVIGHGVVTKGTCHLPFR